MPQQQQQQQQQEGNTPRMNLIAAMIDSTQGIGLNNRLPWHLPKEFAYFVQSTLKTNNPEKQNAVVMGRKCWDSIPAKFRPLKNRLNIVISRKLTEPPAEGVILAHSWEEAVNMLTSEPLVDKIETIWNVGGAEIYRLGLSSPLCHRLYLTRIFHEIECDVFFPKVDWEQFEMVNVPTGCEGEQEEKGIKYRFTVYEKKQKSL